jgi:signal transduction histidine kinase
LSEGAASLTSLVKLVQSNSYERWEKEELKRHKEIYEASTNKNDVLFEARVCQQALSSYRAASADFYSLEALIDAAEWKAGFRTNLQTQKDESAENAPAGFPKQAEIDKLTGSKKVLAWRRVLAKEQMKDPQQAATAGVVERVCIPLFATNQLIGLLDLKWLVDQQHSNPFVYRHSPPHLQQLGEMLGAAYRQYQLAKSQEEAEKAKIEAERLQRQAESEQRELKEKNESVVKATGAYVFQGAHRKRKFMQTIYHLLQLAKLTENERERNEALLKLDKAIEEEDLRLSSSIDKGERLSSLSLKDCDLDLLVNETLETIFQEGKLQNIKIIRKSLNDLIVKTDPELTKEVFINLIDNAVDAMEGRERRELTIAASPLDANTVKLSINDTGKGMTEEQIEAAMKGFVTNNEHKGVGVLISQVLLNVQGGSLKYRSVINVGTEAVVTLPIRL